MKNQSRTDSVELIVPLPGVETLGKCRIIRVESHLESASAPWWAVTGDLGRDGTHFSGIALINRGFWSSSAGIAIPRSQILFYME